MSKPPSDTCAIDFGTSNSAIALPMEEGVRLVEVEEGFTTMPTAVFYAVEGLAAHEDAHRSYGRAAVRSYVEGVEGRLMRSMKSILGSTLAQQATDVGAGRSVGYLDVVAGYLRQLKMRAEAASGAELRRLVLGRPVFFVDDDPVRDAAAQQALETAARNIGFREIAMQYEPIAAALDYESTVPEEQVVLVADIGGGTADFSLVRVGPERRRRADRLADILGNHGVHVAGTDFDRHLELAFVLPTCGHRGRCPDGREVPSRVYFDLATWHLINTVYNPARVAELRRMRDDYADRSRHERLMRVVDGRLGHALMALAEAAKIQVAEAGSAHIDLGIIEASLEVDIHETEATAVLQDDLERIVQAARETLRQASLDSAQVRALYLTGGSTGFAPLAELLAAQCRSAQVVRGDRFASVATGLGIHARQVFR